ncbi:MAG: helix-turn-helix transcriptional regulator [Pelolinea sp.]|nr:helix-turn-helix transcriptional regulator [Pelolinea sp.]
MRTRNTGLRRPRHMRPFLEPAILILLKEKPSYGYKILEDLSEFDMQNMNASLVYRMLARMERFEWIQSTLEASEKAGPARKIYQLNDEGKEILNHWVEKLGMQREKIDTMIKRAKK